MTALENSLAIVTGGNRGIGLAIAETLAGLGIEVVITGRNPRELERAAQSIQQNNGKARAEVCDVTSLSDVDSLKERLRGESSRLRIVVNNAGIGSFGAPLHETAPDTFDRIMNTNLRGVYYMMRAFAPALIANGGGDIVNISSLASKNPVANGAAYAASKAGLNGLSISAAEELRGHNVRVTVVCPGSVHTEFIHAMRGDPGKRLTPNDVAHVVKMVVTQGPNSFASEILLRPTQKP
jgi:3-oxoacyl-[acyl-carrier protein] reductase